MEKPAGENENPQAFFFSYIKKEFIYDREKLTWRLPKAADISDTLFLYYLSDSSDQFEIDKLSELIGCPKKVVLAKARRLVKRELIEGCTCGRCGGYFELTDLGLQRLREDS